MGWTKEITSPRKHRVGRSYMQAEVRRTTPHAGAGGGQLELAVTADELGMDSVWISEAWGQDAVSVLGLLAGRTERVSLGSGLMQIPARQPAAAAMAAATLDMLSGGRFRLGLGVSGPQVSEGWYGVPFRHPVRRTREYVEIVRLALEREGPLRFEGREWRLPLPRDDGGSGLGKPLKLLTGPVQERIRSTSGRSAPGPSSRAIAGDDALSAGPRAAERIRASRARVAAT